MATPLIPSNNNTFDITKSNSSCSSLNNMQLPTPARSRPPSPDYIYKSPIPSPFLPPTPPSSHDYLLSSVIIPTRSNKPTILIPPTLALPPVHSGSVTENFRASLNGIDLDECEAHGENAFFVCDLAEVYKQHMRWKKELGHRVEAFFGEFYIFSSLSFFGLAIEI